MDEAPGKQYREKEYAYCVFVSILSSEDYIASLTFIGAKPPP